jgi:hypothetical protein
LRTPKALRHRPIQARDPIVAISRGVGVVADVGVVGGAAVAAIALTAAELLRAARLESSPTEDPTRMGRALEVNLQAGLTSHLDHERVSTAVAHRLRQSQLPLRMSLPGLRRTSSRRLSRPQPRGGLMSSGLLRLRATALRADIGVLRNRSIG